LRDPTKEQDNHRLL